MAEDGALDGLSVSSSHNANSSEPSSTAMTAPPIPSNSINDPLSDVAPSELRLMQWQRDWHDVKFFSERNIQFSICPPLGTLTSAKSESELMTASKEVLTQIDAWRNTQSTTSIRVSKCMSQWMDPDLKSFGINEKACKILGLSSSDTSMILQEFISLAELAPHVEEFVEEKTEEMKRDLAAQLAADPHRQSDI